jgi:DNA sulfur modification protein DndB
MSLEQVAKNVRYAKEIHKSEKLSELIQRELDEKNRASEIGEYLLKNEDRFFNSLVVAVYDGDPEWHEFQSIKPINEDIHLEDIDYNSRYSVGYLSLTGEEQLFAIDGQHRLAGIRRALKKNKDLGEDEISIIMVAHHTNDAGLQRTRKLFTTLNKTAKPVSKSEIIALDEADAMAIVARQLVESDHRFSDKLIHVMSKQSNLPKNDEHLITLINLYDLLEMLFTKASKGIKSSELKRIRPTDEELDSYKKLASEYFSLIEKQFPTLEKCYASHSPGEYILKQREDGGHVLFRPVGFLIFTDIVTTLMRTEGLNLKQSVEELKRLPAMLSAPPYVGVLWNKTTDTMVIRNKSLTRDLLLYYLGYIKDAKKTSKIKERYSLILEDPKAIPPKA